MHQAWARLIQMSTDYVFDGTKDSWYAESDPISPLGVYGRSKAAGEDAARSCPNHLVLRTAWVYSSHGSNFVKTMLRLGQSRTAVRVVADQIGCPTSAHDLAAALLSLTDSDVTGTFHLAGAEEASWFTFAKRIMDQAGLDVSVEPIETIDFPIPARRPANSRLDSTAVRAATGVEVPGWSDSLPQVLASIQANTDRTHS